MILLNPSQFPYPAQPELILSLSKGEGRAQRKPQA